MLEGLDRVDWDRILGAEGDDSDIPASIGRIPRRAPRNAPTGGSARRLTSRSRLDVEDVTEVTASPLLATGLVGGYAGVDPASAGVLPFLASTDPTIRHAAAIATYPMCRAGMAAVALGLLVELVRRAEDSPVPVAGLPWNGGDLAGLAEQVLAAVGFPYTKYGRDRRAASDHAFRGNRLVPFVPARPEDTGRA